MITQFVAEVRLFLPHLINFVRVVIVNLFFFFFFNLLQITLCVAKFNSHLFLLAAGLFPVCMMGGVKQTGLFPGC